jgi:flagellar protein FlaJ
MAIRIKYFYEIVSVVIGIAILALNFLYISEAFPFIFPLVNVLGGLIAVVPPSLFFYSRYRRNKEIEQQFVIFIRDLTDSINSGMTLPTALEHCSKRDYQSLSPLINDMVAQVQWGVPFRKALRIFSRKSNSVPIKRSITTIIETYKVGGKISDTLEAVGESLIEIGKIKEERTASVHSQIITSYLIYFVFIFILVILQTFLIPALSEMPEGGVGSSSSPEFISAGAFLNFILVQGFFAGLVTGKMAEGSVVAGFKHSILLIATGYTLFSFASQFQFQLF